MNKWINVGLFKILKCRAAGFGLYKLFIKPALARIADSENGQRKKVDDLE